MFQQGTECVNCISNCIMLLITFQRLWLIKYFQLSCLFWVILVQLSVDKLAGHFLKLKVHAKIKTWQKKHIWLDFDLLVSC